MKISTKNFCRGALVLPILLPALLMPIEAGPISVVLLLSVWFAGASYFLFAVLALVWIGRTQRRASLLASVWVAPLVFLPFSMAGWLLHQWLERTSNPNLVINAAELLPIATFTLLVGYAYVLLARFILFVMGRMGVIE